MKERPILFSAPMVRAILEGRKTVTRRIVKPQLPADAALVKVHASDDAARGLRGKCTWFEPGGGDLWPSSPDDAIPCPYGEPGDRLWVRETWQPIWADPDVAPRLTSPKGWRLGYPATDGVQEYVDERRGITTRCKPAIHMPRWASRITLRVTSVRVERLQAITEEDARAEGVTPFPYDPEGDCWTAAPPERAHRTAFEFLWGEINGFGETDARAPGSSWESNPWVWCVGFERVEAADV